MSKLSKAKMYVKNKLLKIKEYASINARKICKWCTDMGWNILTVCIWCVVIPTVGVLFIIAGCVYVIKLVGRGVFCVTSTIVNTWNSFISTVMFIGRLGELLLVKSDVLVI
jgi:hypothetical protein